VSDRWEPATLEEVEAILARDVERLDPDQRALWQECRVAPRAAPIVRYGSQESVFVVAERNGEAIYWEDIEEGFNISPVGPAGEILEHWCNQDELRWALNRWLHPEVQRQVLGPAEPVPE